MRRRRRTRGTWLPTFGTNLEQPNETSAIITGLDFEDSVSIDIEGPTLGCQIFPLTTDYPAEDNANLDPASPMSNFIANEYVLRRIVGKIFAKFNNSPSGGSTNPVWDKVLCGAGFFVARADGAGSAQGGQAPIGTDNAVQAWNSQYNPLHASTMREPWIWRRTWILQDPLGSDLTDGTWGFPRCIGGYGQASSLDSGHVDAKTIRRVGNDDRLWFAWASIPWPLTIDGEEAIDTASIEVHLDYRLFGSLRKAKGKGAF